ncbi:restriction endonuclease [Gracilibacillus salitolerans]|uniref:Restriction endonuclease n=1 Tax=Gracilibacillus salitolerans TaxID=2663022 RepID=A0A5Q2TEP3_9BACI|nr:restriction endonuclease [Gracilibacillus salitolerans]QGH32582.1 restriction endonuclease [Gracilibacillus salitolerans]
MGKKRKNSILYLIRIILIFIGLAYYFSNINELHWGFLFVAVIIPVVIEGILNLLIPEKQANKKTAKKTNSTNISKNSQKNNYNKVPTTRLLSDKEIIKMPLENMSGAEFERLCFLYYKAKGYKPKETPKGADGGVDLLIYQRYHQQYEAVQIKHYLNSGNQITVSPIRELNSSKQNHGCVLARFITTSTYTKEAMLQADKWRIKTHSIDWVQNKIEAWRKEEAKKPKYA